MTEKTGLKAGIELYEYQKHYVKTILNDIEKTNKINYFISLPQGAGKTLIALSVLSELLNEEKVDYALILAPRRVLVNQWIEEAENFFYGLKVMEGPTLSNQGIGKTRALLKHSNACAIAMTIQSFKNYMKKDYFRERDFDLVILDEASDSTLARDFLEKYRMSYYLEGLERWSNLKLLLFPKKVKEEKLDEMIKKFNEKLSELIRKEPESIKKLEYNIKDPILIDDPLVNEFVEILDDEYRGIRRKVTNLLKKFNVKGYQENLETLLQHKMMARVKKIYQLDDDTVNAIQVMITKYILMKHLRKWFLYSNREELKRTLLASQFQVREWLENKDKKLAKLKATISDLLCKNKRIYIYSEYISTAEMIFNYLKEELDLKDEDMEMITGKVEDQYERLNNFKEDGKILIATPVFDKGTDIPEVDSIIIFTPPANMEKMHQIKGRIRGGDVIMLAYKGREEEIIEETVRLLRD